VLVHEPEMSVCDVDDHSSWVIMRHRSLMRAVVDIDDLHPFVFESQSVVSRFNLGGILSKTSIDAEQAH